MDSLLQRQRLDRIVASYALAGEAEDLFSERLQQLLQQYPSVLIEWALVEVLVQNWLRYPLPRGLAFITQVEAKLQQWQTLTDASIAVTPSQFEQVTGLPVDSSALIVSEQDWQFLDTRSLSDGLGNDGDPAN
ncbi:MAG: hypothetical protein AAGH78_04855 [Cyanobacteria bacterium P01_H01_bin.58]